MKPLKFATQEQAQQAYDQDNFVYHNPCCKCNKECSTPTKDIWLKRIREFGSISDMYSKYVCRNCRKGADKDVAIKDVVAKATEPVIMAKAAEPLPRQMATSPMMKAKAERPMIHIQPEKPQRQPGDYMEPKPGEMGFSIWENGIYKGTAWHKTGEKIS